MKNTPCQTAEDARVRILESLLSATARIPNTGCIVRFDSRRNGVFTVEERGTNSEIAEFSFLNGVMFLRNIEYWNNGVEELSQFISPYIELSFDNCEILRAPYEIANEMWGRTTPRPVRTSFLSIEETLDRKNDNVFNLDHLGFNTNFYRAYIVPTSQGLLLISIQFDLFGEKEIVSNLHDSLGSIPVRISEHEGKIIIETNGADSHILARDLNATLGVDNIYPMSKIQTASLDDIPDFKQKKDQLEKLITNTNSLPQEISWDIGIFPNGEIAISVPSLSTKEGKKLAKLARAIFDKEVFFVSFDDLEIFPKPQFSKGIQFAEAQTEPKSRLSNVEKLMRSFDAYIPLNGCHVFVVKGWVFVGKPMTENFSQLIVGQMMKNKKCFRFFIDGSGDHIQTTFTGERPQRLLKPLRRQSCNKHND